MSSHALPGTFVQPWWLDVLIACQKICASLSLLFSQNGDTCKNSHYSLLFQELYESQYYSPVEFLVGTFVAMKNTSSSHWSCGVTIQCLAPECRAAVGNFAVHCAHSTFPAFQAFNELAFPAFHWGGIYVILYLIERYINYSPIALQNICRLQ